MTAYVVSGLGFGPQIFRRLLSHIAKDKLDLSLEEGRFTPREVIAHLADWEPIFQDRIRRAIANPGCGVEVFDEAEMAVAHRYDLTDVEEQLALFTKHRAESLALIASLRSDQLAIHFNHPERGMLTVDDQVSLGLGHDVYHIDQLLAYLDASSMG